MKIENFEEQKIKETKNKKNIYDTKISKLVSLSNTISYKVSEERLKEHDKYKELSDKFWKEFAHAYIKIILYISQLAQTKTRAEVTPEEKQFFLNFQTMNQSLGIDYQLPPFKESHETQTINTMADVYYHTDTLIQDKNAWFQDYINNSPSTQAKETSSYKNDKLKPQDLCKLYPKRSERQDDRQRTNPEWFDPYTKQFDLNKVDQNSRINVEEKYEQAKKHGQEFLTNLDQQTQANIKNQIMSFVLKEFASLFMLSSNYDASHLGQDFSLSNIQSTSNGTVRIEGSLDNRKIGMDYSLATGELRVDDFLYQQFPEWNFSIDPESPGKYKLNGRLASFDEQYQRKPKIDLTQIIQEESDPQTIQTKTEAYTTKILKNNYQRSKNYELQSQVIALVEKNKIVQDRLDIFVPWAVEDIVTFGGVNNADEQAFWNMLNIRHNTIDNIDPNQLAKIGQSMNQLADFCKQLESSSTIRQSFQDGATDQPIKDRIFALSKELSNIDSTQRGKAFANLIGNDSWWLLVQDGKLQASDIQTLVHMCQQHDNIENTDGFSQHFKNVFYDTSIDVLA